MALKIKKQNRETSQSLIRRFSKRMKRSGILLQARKIRYRKRPKSPQMKKRAALRKEELRKEHERLKKMGKPK
jgi:ribosomal protein S21